MPLVYQQNINAVTKMGVWHITETEDFFLQQVPLQKEITHWHKRLQHLAGRYLLKELYPGFPLELIKIADTKIESIVPEDKKEEPLPTYKHRGKIEMVNLPTSPREIYAKHLVYDPNGQAIGEKELPMYEESPQRPALSASLPRCCQYVAW